MPGKTTRRVGQTGTSRSRYLTLPRAWCDGTGIAKGTSVDVLYDGVLIVIPLQLRRTLRETLVRLSEEVAP